MGSRSLLQGIFSTQVLNRITSGFFLLSEPPEEPKNTGVGGLSLLQQIFPVQESNRGLRHCRQILYQLSYQGSDSNDNKANSATEASVMSTE